VNRPRYLPIFSPKDHNAFWRLINPDFPDTYDKWLKLHLKERAEFERLGETVIDVQVYPSEFVRFCEVRECACTLKSLEDFAVEKAPHNN
jgi:hypothetical protein